MLFIKALIFILFFTVIASWEDKSELTVQINDGTILGRYMASETSLPVRAFLGIPYASPPINNLRFKAPQKVEKWEGVKNTQRDSPICTQINPFGRIFDVVTGQEDCLYLNVYTPAKRSIQTKFPVIYWIHGGGWTRGEASNFMYGHEHLLDNDVILVTGNYRVGPLGFLSTEDKNSPGNFAFKDQSWGESAGGASVNYHMISPLSQPNFHRAISHSGALMECWSDPAKKGTARAQAIRLANAFNCSTELMDEMVTCLRAVEASNLTLAIAKLYSWDYDPVVLFMPVVEDFDTDEDKFIVSRNFSSPSTNIPWLICMNSEENLLKLAAFLENQTFYDNLIENWDDALSSTFYYYDIDKALIAEISKEINTFYFGSEEPTDLYTQSLINLFTDGWFIGFIEALKQRFSASSQSNTYVYLFTHKSTASYQATSQYYGTSHVDDLIPFFPMRRNIFFSSKPTNEDNELATKLPKMWINFAITGNPNMQPLLSNVPQWPVATAVPFDYLQIGNENGNSNKLFEVKNNLYEARSEFWINLREKYNLNRWVHY